MADGFHPCCLNSNAEAGVSAFKHGCGHHLLPNPIIDGCIKGQGIAKFDGVALEYNINLFRSFNAISRFCIKVIYKRYRK